MTRTLLLLLLLTGLLGGTGWAGEPVIVEGETIWEKGDRMVRTVEKDGTLKLYQIRGLTPCEQRMEAAMRAMDDFIPDDLLGTMKWERDFVHVNPDANRMEYRAEKEKQYNKLDHARTQWHVAKLCWRQP